MLDSGETYILTRHRRIAETACEALREDGYDVDSWYPYLASSALKEFVQRRSGNPDIGRWVFDLANYFINKGANHWPLARSVAKALFEARPNDPLRLTVYSKVLRETRVPGEAMALLRAKGEQFRSRRDILYEWGVVAGVTGDLGLNAWLGARSLADGGSPLAQTQCKLSLAGLGRAFEFLYETGRQPIFAEARAACGRLGLQLTDLDATSRSHFQRYVGAQAGRSGPVQPPESDIRVLQRAVSQAADEMEPDNGPPFFERLLGEPDRYRYSELLRIIAGAASPKRAG